MQDPTERPPVMALFPAGSGGPAAKIGRNDPCPCASGRKFKKCHLTRTPPGFEWIAVRARHGSQD